MIIVLSEQIYALINLEHSVHNKISSPSRFKLCERRCLLLSKDKKNVRLIFKDPLECHKSQDGMDLDIFESQQSSSTISELEIFVADFDVVTFLQSVLTA